jgi:hypothetical protein
MNWIKHPLEPRHLGVPSGASKMISQPMVRSAQTLHLSCVKINTISNELSQASTWASSPRSTIWCVRNNFWAYVCLAQSYTDLEPTPALSPNGPKWDFTRPTSPWSSIVCVQNNFWECGTFCANRATILHQVWHYLQSNWIVLLLEP